MEETVNKEVFSIKLKTIPIDTCKDSMCSKSQSWTGFFLMKNNSSFEGVVKNDGYNTNNWKDNQLIIGKYIDQFEIELMKYDHLTFSSHYFTAIYGDEKLSGNVNLCTPLHGIYPLGKCEILIDNIKMNNIDIEKLEREINKFKSSTNDSNKALIEEFSTNQNVAVKIKN